QVTRLTTVLSSRARRETFRAVSKDPSRGPGQVPKYTTITLTREGAIARLVLNRPERRNALTHAMMLELEDAFTRLRDDAACRVLVLRGAGGHFCAGGDLGAMAAMPAEPGNGAVDPMLPAYRQFG